MVPHNTRRNVGPCADRLVKVEWRQFISAGQQRYESIRHPGRGRNVIGVEPFVGLTTREIGIGSRTIEAKINVNTVLIPKKVYLTVVGEGQVRQWYGRHRQSVDEGTGIFKRSAAWPLCGRPSFRTRLYLNSGVRQIDSN